MGNNMLGDTTTGSWPTRVSSTLENTSTFLLRSFQTLLRSPLETWSADLWEIGHQEDSRIVVTETDTEVPADMVAELAWVEKAREALLVTSTQVSAVVELLQPHSKSLGLLR